MQSLKISWDKLFPPGSVAEKVCHFVRGHREDAYLVGGYLRDRLLGRLSHDLDIAVPTGAVPLARAIADHFGGPFVLLDAERDTGRVLLRDDQGQQVIVDVARFRAPDILADLRGRDFTINALALSLMAPEEEPEILDPCGGLPDLKQGLIRAVSEGAFRQDPLRTLRAVRLAAELGFRVEPRTREWLREATGELRRVSAERVRDELVRLVSLPRAAEHLADLDRLGVLPVIIPELEPLKGLEQPPPHRLDAFTHSLETVHTLEELVIALRTGPTTPPLTLAVESLAPHAQDILAHLGQPISSGRNRESLLRLVALLHDIGKPITSSVDAQGKGHFIGHERVGAQLVADILRRLRFSREEVERGQRIVAHHLRPVLLAREPRVTRRAIYRFFRDTKEEGIEVVLLSLADGLARGKIDDHAELPPQWQRRLEVATILLKHYFERREQVIVPPRLLSGDDLMQIFGLEPGPRLGELLEALREAQAAGEVSTREEALQWVRTKIEG